MGIRLNTTRSIVDSAVQDYGYQCLAWNDEHSWDTLGELPRTGDAVTVSSYDDLAIPCVSVSARSAASEMSRLVVDANPSDSGKVIVLGTCPWPL